VHPFEKARSEARTFQGRRSSVKFGRRVKTRQCRTLGGFWPSKKRGRGETEEEGFCLKTAPRKRNSKGETAVRELLGAGRKVLRVNNKARERCAGQKQRGGVISRQSLSTKYYKKRKHGGCERHLKFDNISNVASRRIKRSSEEVVALDSKNRENGSEKMWTPK